MKELIEIINFSRKHTETLKCDFSLQSDSLFDVIFNMTRVRKHARTCIRTKKPLKDAKINQEQMLTEKLEEFVQIH